jgi:hypothetical protein
MSAEEELEDDDVRLPYIYDATVVDDADPLGLGRVRVMIPGVIEPKSDWAYPIGTMGGGRHQRGFFNVPETGSTVAVYFHQGDPDHPRYFSGFWNDQGEDVVTGEAGSQLPTRVRDRPVEQRKHLRAFETERWMMVFDDRETPKNEAGEPVDDPGNPHDGQDTFILLHKESGDFFEIDGGRRGMTIQTTGGLLIRAQGMIDIDGLVVQIAGRKVLKTGGIIS